MLSQSAGFTVRSVSNSGHHPREECPHGDSNPDFQLERLVSLPLDDGGVTRVRGKTASASTRPLESRPWSSGSPTAAFPAPCVPLLTRVVKQPTTKLKRPVSAVLAGTGRLVFLRRSPKRLLHYLIRPSSCENPAISNRRSA